MALFQALLAFVLRSFGRILNTAFGWATTLLFGKVPARRQIYLSLTTFASVIWFCVACGIASPRFAAFLLAFITLPEWVNDNALRIVMALAAVAIPPVIGVLSMIMLDPIDRPKTAGAKARRILAGYPYAFGLAVSMLCMVLVAPVLQLRALLRCWKTQHVPVIVELDDYLEVVNDLQGALRRGGIETRRERATWLLRAPTRFLTLFAGDEFKKVVADNLIVLVSPCCEVLLHPSDLVIRGREREAARIHATLTEQLTFTKAYLTWDKEANRLEDRIRELWVRLVAVGDRKNTFDRASLDELRSIEEALAKLSVTYEEWEVLFREKLQVERCLLRLAAGVDVECTEKVFSQLSRRAA